MHVDFREQSSYEISVYKDAKQQSLHNALTKIYGTLKVYDGKWLLGYAIVAEKVTPMTSSKRYNAHELMNDFYGNDAIYYCYRKILKTSVKEQRRLEEAINALCLYDIHEDNIGFRNKKIKILDYGC